MMETWRPVVGHEKFEVSSLGRFRISPEKIYALEIDKRGYVQVIVRDKGERIHLRIHREVAKAFIDQPSGKDYVNHIDGDKTNNRVDNLEWCTASENHLHRVHVLGKAPTYHKTVKVLCVETGVVYESCNSAARAVGGDGSNINKCCRRTHWTHKGFHWRFAE